MVPLYFPLLQRPRRQLLILPSTIKSEPKADETLDDWMLVQIKDNTRDSITSFIWSRELPIQRWPKKYIVVQEAGLDKNWYG